MDHSPIYRSETRRAPTQRGGWRRPASLTVATAALAVSGVALGYQGLLTTSGQPNGGGTVQTAGATVGSHPGALGVVSAALLEQFRAGEGLIQVLLPSAAPPPPARQSPAAAAEDAPVQETADTPVAVQIVEPELTAATVSVPPSAPAPAPRPIVRPSVAEPRDPIPQFRASSVHDPVPLPPARPPARSPSLETEQPAAAPSPSSPRPAPAAPAVQVAASAPAPAPAPETVRAAPAPTVVRPREDRGDDHRDEGEAQERPRAPQPPVVRQAKRAEDDHAETIRPAATPARAAPPAPRSPEVRHEQRAPTPVPPVQAQQARTQPAGGNTAEKKDVPRDTKPTQHAKEAKDVKDARGATDAKRAKDAKDGKDAKQAAKKAPEAGSGSKSAKAQRKGD